jgi:YD repeat-containing protein
MQRGLLTCVVGAALVVGASARVYGQTVYHLHKELSLINSANKQLKTIGPESGVPQTAFQTVNLKNNSGNVARIIANFETQTGVPGRAGTIASGSTLSLTLRMKITALPASGNIYPHATIQLNNASSPYLCIAGGPFTPVAALTTTLAWYTFSCTTSSAVVLTTSDRFFVTVNAWLAGNAGNHNLFGELDVETNADSTVTIPNPAASITSLNPTSGFVGQSVTVTGTAFGATQGSSTVKFYNDKTAAIGSWGNTSISTTVPAGATTGPVVVRVNNDSDSNGVTFTVVPHITSLTPLTAGLGQTVTIAGTTFGGSQGGSTVTVNGTIATPSSWSDTSISVPVPSGATSGPVVVTAGGNASNGVDLTVVTTGTISGAITRTTGGSAVSGATVQAVLAGIVKGTATSAANGTYTVTNLGPGTHDVRISATGFAPELRQSVAVSANVTTTLNVGLSQPGSVDGAVTQSNGTTPIVGASVALYQGAMQKGTAATNGSGAYSLSGLHPGAYTLQVSSVGYATQEAGVTISESSNTTRNVSLQNAAAGQVTYVYDEIGRLVSVVDPGGNAATYRYDAVGNVTAIERPGSTAVSISEFTPNAAPVGTTVLIYGTGFSATPSSNTVTFNGSSATVTAATSTQLTVAVPSAATTGPIGVSAPGGSATTSTSFTVTAASAGAPTITTFSPQIWAGTGSLTITGTNFDTTLANDRVMLNGLNGSVTNATATSLTVQVPQVASSGHVSVATLAGSATSSGDFFVPPVGYLSSNIQATARMTVGGNSLPLSFPAGGKFSLLVFDGTPGHRVGATFSSVVLPNGSAAMYDPAGARTASAFLDAGYVETGTIGSSSSYTLLVEAPAGNTGSATVTLTDIVDPAATITADGPAVTISTTAAGQNGLVTFSGTAGQRISLVASNPMVNNGQSFFCDMNLIFTKPNGSILFPSPICAEVGAFIDTTVLPASGTYTIIVDLANLATGSVTLNLYTVPADLTGSITAGGSPVTMATSVPGQNASLTFNGTANQRISLIGSDVTYGGAPFTCDLNVTILNPDNSVLVPATCMETGGYVDTTTLPTTGVYKIQIDPYTASTGSMTLTLNDIPADFSGSITAGGSAVTVTTTVAGQNGQLTFSGAMGDRIALLGTNNSYSGTPFTCDVTVAILNPDNSVLAPATCMELGGFIDTTSLPATGTYKVQIDPYSTVTGSLTLTLYSVPADVTGTITIGGSAVPVSLSAIGQNGSFTFSATANQHISLQVTAVSGFNTTFDCDVNVSILKPDNSPLVNPTCMDFGGTIGSTAIPTTGTYTIFVNPAGPNTGSLTLTLTAVP